MGRTSMSSTRRRMPVSLPRSWVLVLGLIVVAFFLAGCAKQATAEPTPTIAAYRGALETSYQDALDVTSQLALGTLKLEETEHAVTKEEAAGLLPLWQALDGSELQGDAERNAVLKQVEATMAGAQIAAIREMQLTQEDAQTWMQSQGGDGAAGSRRPGGRAPQGGPGGQNTQPQSGGQFQNMSDDERATRRAEFQNMSAEERATRMAQFIQQGGPGAGMPSMSGGASGGLIRGVINLLSERSGVQLAQSARPTAAPTGTPVPARTRARATPTEVVPDPNPTPTAEHTATPKTTSSPTPVPTQTATPSPTPEPVVYVVRAGDSLASIARAYGVTVAALVEANGIEDPNTIRIGQKLAIPNPGQVP